jgi:hypothetical protein
VSLPGLLLVSVQVIIVLVQCHAASVTGCERNFLLWAGCGDGGQPEAQRCGKYDPPFVATVSPSFADGWLGMLNGDASKVSLGVLPALWTLTGRLYILGGLLFGIATFRSRICRVGLAYCWLRGPHWPRGRTAFPWVAAENSDTDGG